ncbi:MAG: helix-turn-helix domain-containing protein [Sphingomonas sp.]|nr:helix-turn-helix domain-containing protein [Sphingomonas sp.]
MAMGLKGTYAAPAIEKAFEVMELLATRAEGALISEIAAQLGRSVGELFRIVVVLEQLGYLHKSSTSDRYTVAYKLLDLAYRAAPAHDLVRAAMPEMQVLALESGQSCHLVVPNGGQGMVIAREEQPGMRGFALKVGARIDIINSCSGQVILAFSNLQHAERIVRAAGSRQGTAANRDRPRIGPAWLSARRISRVKRGWEVRALHHRPDEGSEAGLKVRG